MEKSEIWQNYRRLFPVRYLDHNQFDDYLISLPLKDKEILSVGGGVLKPSYLKKVDLLDPYVADTDFTNQINWDSPNKYDLIIARGSINYLSEEEYLKLGEFLKEGGELIFNTFLRRPQDKQVSGLTLEGEPTEEFISVKNDEIFHALKVNGEFITSHIIFYRTLDFFYKLKMKEMRIYCHGSNSAIVHITV